MRLVLQLLLLPFTLAGFVASLIDRAVPKLGKAGWLLRIVQIPLMVLSLPSLIVLGSDDSDEDEEDEEDEEERRLQPLPSTDLSFEQGPWTTSGVLGQKLSLTSGGKLEFYRPKGIADLDPMERRCLEEGVGIEDGLRFGGLRLTQPASERVTALYVAQCDERCLTAKFEGSSEEEVLADALMASMRRASKWAAVRQKCAELEQRAARAMERDEVAEARAFREESLSLCRADSNTAPKSATAQLAVSRALRFLGEVAEAQKDLDAAEAHSQEALSLVREVARTQPSRATAQRELCVSLLLFGSLNLERKRFDAAARAVEEAVDLAHARAATAPGDPEAQWHLATCHHSMGGVFAQQGRNEEAATSFAEAMRVLRGISGLDTSSPKIKAPLYLFASGLGDARLAQGLHDAAEEPLQQALSIVRTLVASDPGELSYRLSLAATLEKLGRIASHRRDAAARAHFDEARHLLLAAQRETTLGEREEALLEGLKRREQEPV